MIYMVELESYDSSFISKSDEQEMVRVPISEFQGLFIRMQMLASEIDTLRNEIRGLKETLGTLEGILSDFPLNIRVIDVKDVPFDEAKNMIYDYYKTHKTEMIYPDEVADELGLDLKVTMKAVEELFEEGKLEEAE